MAKRAFVMKPYAPASDDPLRDEHIAVSKWIEDVFSSLRGHEYYRDVELKRFPSGQLMLDAKPGQAKRYVLAAVAQAAHLDAESDRVRAQCETETERMNTHLLPGWSSVWGRRRQAAAVAFALTKRALPWEEDELLAILDWCAAGDYLSAYHYPLGSIVRALERYVGSNKLTGDLRQMQAFASRLRATNEKDAKRLGTVVEQLCVRPAAQEMAEMTTSGGVTAPSARQPPAPAPAGNPAVMEQLKRHLGLDVPRHDVATEPIGLDRFRCPADSPLRREHEHIDQLLTGAVVGYRYEVPPFDSSDAGRAILAMETHGRGRVLLAAAERHIATLIGGSHTNAAPWQARYAVAELVAKLSILSIELNREELFDFLLYFALRPSHMLTTMTSGLLKHLEPVSIHSNLAPGERYVLHLLRTSLITAPALGTPSEQVAGLTQLIGDGANFFLVPGEVWADALNADLTTESPARREAWVGLLRHLLRATAARPTEKWLKTAGKLVNAVGAQQLRAALAGWLPLVVRGRSVPRLAAYTGDTRGAGDVMHDENATCLRGFLWLVPTLPENDELLRLTSAVALSAYKKVPGVGPRAVKVGNAAVYALSKIGSEEAVGQLAMLKVRVKFGTAQKEIEKAFNAAAEALGIPRDQIEEMGVPSYGLEEVGVRRETFANGEFIAELRVDGRDAVISWSRADGKPQKSVPAKVKTDHKDELKELQAAAKDIAGMLPAQAERIDSRFLLQKRWPIKVWRERYLDHPLVGTIARRLIWSIRNGGRDRSGIWHEGRVVDQDDNPLDLASDAEVELWHPHGRPLDDVLAWRAWLDRHAICQPFKQAHREVYLLTDAERRTGTYSNRFAAHILRQHQFNALCAARGWKNKLRLMVDDVYPPAWRELPNWRLRAEFWIEGIGADYGTDTNESGVYLRVATDQVRFYRIEAQQNLAHAGGGGYGAGYRAAPADPLPLDQVPPLVFSEIMRDVDLFVGVASVGNDPTWQDGGPGGRFRDYWRDYSFGELGETAKTRREVLERLVPRLKIAARCSLSDKFLVVRGDIRTYKIHLGSGNILMEPNDQYLCIVPARGAAAGSGTDRLFLPFEGDATLSIILSKAFLLADDTKINDSTILQQIKHR